MPDGPSYLPLFPLNIVVFPFEEINLHIFEPRYIQLINECYEQNRAFGMPPHIGNQLPGLGTTMRIAELVNRHADGTMDIRCLGEATFKILEFINPAPGKLYAHGAVAYNPAPETNAFISNELLEAVKELYRLLHQPLKYPTQGRQSFSFQIGHGVGLSLENEYKLLSLETEMARQDYLLNHLEQIIPVAQNLERTKERIRMNGDFRIFGALDL